MRDRIDIPLIPIPTEADIDRDTDEIYERRRDEFCAAWVIDRIKGDKQ